MTNKHHNTNTKKLNSCHNSASPISLLPTTPLCLLPHNQAKQSTFSHTYTQLNAAQHIKIMLFSNMNKDGDCITNVVAMSLFKKKKSCGTYLSYCQIIQKQNSPIVAINVTATNKTINQ
jgi:hypothetical protein